MRPILFTLIILSLFGALYAEMTPRDTLQISIRVEEMLLAGEIEAYGQLYTIWSQEYQRYQGLHDGLLQVFTSDSLEMEDIRIYNAQLQVQWSYLNAMQFQISDLTSQVLQRMAKIEVLKAEEGIERETSKITDPLTGKWEVFINPGDLSGIFNLKLSTTLLMGSYSISGGWTGSLKGTLVGDRVRLERIDSEKGFIAIYYGRLNKEEETISGTWESTMFTTGGPMTGTWSARKRNEP